MVPSAKRKKKMGQGHRGITSLGISNKEFEYRKYLGRECCFNKQKVKIKFEALIKGQSKGKKRIHLKGVEPMRKIVHMEGFHFQLPYSQT